MQPPALVRLYGARLASATSGEGSWPPSQLQVGVVSGLPSAAAADCVHLAPGPQTRRSFPRGSHSGRAAAGVPQGGRSVGTRSGRGQPGASTVRARRTRVSGAAAMRRGEGAPGVQGWAMWRKAAVTWAEESYTWSAAASADAQSARRTRWRVVVLERSTPPPCGFDPTAEALAMVVFVMVTLPPFTHTPPPPGSARRRRRWRSWCSRWSRCRRARTRRRPRVGPTAEALAIVLFAMVTPALHEHAAAQRSRPDGGGVGDGGVGVSWCTRRRPAVDPAAEALAIILFEMVRPLRTRRRPTEPARRRRRWRWWCS